MCGDFITEDLGRVLASVCGGDPGGIQSLIENEAVDEWVRGAALSALVTLVAARQKSREEIVSYLGQLFRGKLERKFSHVWNSLVSHSTHLYPAELIDDIEQAYRDNLVEPGYIGWDNVKRSLARGKDRAMARLADNGHHRLVEDAVKEIERWACFPKDEPADQRFPIPAVAPPPLKRDQLKAGRNEPCPCGSGKKYKKCCVA